MQIGWTAFVCVLLVGCGRLGFNPVNGRDGGSDDTDTRVLLARAGENFTCAVRASDHRVYCWGANDDGQLGDGTTTSRSAPGPIVGFADEVSQLVTAPGIACVLATTGAVWCWGNNASGAVSPSVGAGASAPTHVLDGATQISTASDHSCAVLTTGDVWCWGDNTSDQLGRSTGPLTSAQVGTDNAEVVVLAASTCVRKLDGSVWCFGDDTIGALGDRGVSMHTPNPQRVAGVSAATQLAGAYNQFCARQDGGTLWCWGYGFLGDGTTARTSPVAVVPIVGATAVEVGHTAICAELADRTLCFGINSDGILGDHRFTPAYAPIASIEAVGLAHITLGYAHACAIDGNGELVCWGFDGTGQLGYDVELVADSPRAVVGVTHATKIFANTSFGSHICALQDGEALCWGGGVGGELGDGTMILPTQPMAAQLANVIDVSPGAGSTCAVTSANAVYCWGQNYTAATGSTAINSALPVKIAGTGSATTVWISLATACAVRTDASLACWGENDLSFQVGTGMTPFGYASPTQIAGMTGVSSTSLGIYVSCAVAAGTLSCWGGGPYNLTADGLNHPTPHAVAGVPAMKTVSLGYFHACGVAVDGGLWCWGQGAAAGYGYATGTSTGPVQIMPANSVVDVSAGVSETCVATTSGTVQCVGEGYPASTSFTTIAGLSNIVQVVALNGTVCARSATGLVQCLGHNDYEMLGDGAAVFSLTGVAQRVRP